MVEYQMAFLLLQLLGAESGRLSKGEANDALRTGRNKRLGLSAAKDANALRELLCPRDIREFRARGDKGRDKDFYELTDQGKARLLEISFYPLEIQIPGRAIERLREAAARRRSDERIAVATHAERPANPPVELEREILRVFEELRRERFLHTGLVPIPEVRKAIRAAHGDATARHDVLDAKVLNLWRAGRVRLVPINDGRTVRAEELSDAIPGAHETWFYLESVS